jgi:PKD repeat protein
MPISIHKKYFIALLLGLGLFCHKAFAQSSTMGTEFWLGFMENNSGGTPISVFVSSPVATTGTVSIPGLAWSQNFAVAPNTTVQINIPAAAEVVGQSGVILNRGIRVTANSPVHVYANSEKTGSSDAALILPKHLLGLDYLVLTHSTVANSWNKSEFMVAATEDGTQIEIIPSVATQNGWPANVPQTLTLNQGQVVQIQSAGSGDLTGTRVRAAGSTCGNSPTFAVFAGNVCANIGGCTFCDHLFEQMIPIAKFGSQYISAPLMDRTGGDFIKIMAITDNTTVQVNGNTVATLNCGQTHNLSGNITTQACFITANKPIAVGQFSRGQSCDNTNFSDPFFILLSPIEVMPNTNVTISGMNLGSYYGHRVNIVTATANTANVTCTCGPLTWTPVPGNPAFSTARRATVPGNSTINSTGTGFYATVYGWGGTSSATSYGYAGGGALIDLAFQIQAPNQICRGNPINFSAQSTLSITEVTWNFGDGSPPVVSNNPSHTYTKEGIYTVTATISTSLSCGNVPNADQFCVTKIVEVVPNPIAALGNIEGVCQGGSGQIPITIANASSGGINYPWTLEYTINGQSQTRTGVGNSNFNLSFTNILADVNITLNSVTINTGGLNCATPLNQNGTLVVSPPPIPDFTIAPAALCIGATATVALANSQAPNTAYTWNFGGGFPTNANTAGPHTISWNSPGLKTISLQILAPGCNPSSATQTVTVFPFPTSSFSANPNPICEFQQTTLSFSGTTQGNALFLWNIPEQTGSFNTAGPFSLSWSQAGVKTLTLQTIENGCSSAVSTVLLTVNPNPVANMIAEPAAICLDNTTRLTYTGTPASVYTWGCDGCNQGNTQGRGPHILSWSAPGVKTLSLRVATAEGCASELIQRVFEVFPLPSPPSAVLQHRCGPGVISFTAASPAETAVRLFSQASGGLPLQVSSHPYALETPHLTATTTFFLESVVLATGCSSSTRPSIVAIVEPLPAPPSAISLARCGPGPMTITALTGNPPANLVRLYAVPVEGTSIQTDNAAPFNFFINPAIVTTTYYLEAQNTITGCISPTRSPVVLTVHPIPGTPEVLPLERCGPGGVSFTPIINQPSGNQINIYTQPVGGAPRLTSAAPPFELTTFPLSQTTSLYIEYINTQTGCTSSRNVFTVTIKPLPTPPLQNSLERCGPGEFVFNPSLAADSDRLRVYQPQNNLAAEIAAPYSYTTPALETTTTYYLAAYNTQTQCESPPTQVVALINPQAKNPVLTSNAPVCLGSDMNIVATLQLDGVFYTWKRPGGKPDTVTQSPILWVYNASYTDTGLYTVYAWTPQGCNAPPASIRVGIRDLPLTPDVTFYNVFRESVPLCEGQEINLAVLNYPSYPEGTEFHWEGPNNFQHSPHPFPGVDTAGLYSQGWYYVRATYNGCTSKVGGIYVPVYPVPLKPLALNNSPICVGDSSLLTLSVASPLDNLRFEWVGPNNFIATGHIVQRPALRQNAGVYTLTAISQQGCRSKEAYTQVTFNYPTTDLQFEAPSNLCQGQALRLKANLIPGATYHWSGPANFSQTTSTNEAVILQPSPLNSGLYSLTATVNGCPSPTSTRFVAITPAPEKPIVTALPVFCEGGNLNLKVINPPLSGSLRFQGPNQVDFVSANPELIISNISIAATGIYRITAIENGCSSSVAEIDVNVYPRPPLTAQSAPPQPCVGDSLLLFAQSVPGAQFRWSGPGGFSATTANAIRPGLTLQDAGAYTVYAIANGCTSIAQRLSVTVRNAPLITSISGENEVCQGAPLSLTANAIPGATYRWLGPNDFSASGPTLSINPATTVHSGLYSVQAVVTGCASAPFIQPVNIKPIPEPGQFFSNSPICAGSQLILTAIHSSSAAQFIITGPNGFNVSGTGPNFTRLRVSANDAGAYRLIAIVNDCTSSTQILNIAVNRAPSQPILNAPNTVCEGATLQLSAVGEQGVQYIWQGPAGFFTTGNPVSLVLNSTTASGNYTVRAAANGCTSSIAGRFVQVQSAPSPPVLQSNLPLCQGQTLYLTVANSQNNLTYQWEGPDNFTAAGAAISRMLERAEYAGQYTVRAFNGACASPPASVAVTFEEKPLVIAESNSPICEGDGLQLEATLIPGASYKWIGPNNFESSVRNPFRANAAMAMSGNYYVVAQLGACISDPVSVTVQVAPRPAPPTLSAALGPYCEGQSLVLSASASMAVSFLWSGPAGFTSEERSPALKNITTANAGTYAVVARQGQLFFFAG